MFAAPVSLAQIPRGDCTGSSSTCGLDTFGSLSRRGGLFTPIPEGPALPQELQWDPATGFCGVATSRPASDRTAVRTCVFRSPLRPLISRRATRPMGRFKAGLATVEISCVAWHLEGQTHFEWGCRSGSSFRLVRHGKPLYRLSFVDFSPGPQAAKGTRCRISSPSLLDTLKCREPARPQ